MVASLSLLSLGCTARASGPELWAKACARSLDQVHEGGAQAQAECEESMNAHPLEVADDMARCIMRGPPAGSPEGERRAFRICISAETKSYLDKREAAHELVREIGEAVDELGREGQQLLPASLAELPSLPSEGPWGHPIYYHASGPRDPDFPSYELCVVGPDGALGSKDDICRAPAFIYFQF